jgi:hypothetical protein
MVHVNISSLNYLWLSFSYLYWTHEFHLLSNSITFWLQLYCDILDFANIFFPLTYRSSIMRSKWTCPFVIWQKLCITSGCSSWENAALVYTQWHLMTMFVLSNNLCCIDNTCKVVQLVMDLIKMNCCWGGHKDRVIVLNLWLMWQITHLGHLSQITFHTSREKRCLGLLSDVLIIF